jgi:tRNA A-37 threonylcarbamoyl transferase component Bud32
MRTLDTTEPSAECKLGEGREAELFDLGEGHVLRLYRSDKAEGEVRYQANLLQQIGNLGVRVPRVFEVVSTTGRPGIVMERLDGPDLLTDVARRPWRVLHIGALCGRLHARLNEAPAPAIVPSLHDSLRQRITQSQIVPAHYAELALDALSRLAPGDKLCHLDFHPGNVVISRGEPVVIDWTIAASGPAEADFTQSQLVLSLGEPPPGSPAHLKALALFGRSLLLASYRRAYRRSHQVNESTVRRWHLPLAVARLTAGIKEEATRLTRRIDRLIESEGKQ